MLVITKVDNPQEFDEKFANFNLPAEETNAFFGIERFANGFANCRRVLPDISAYHIISRILQQRRQLAECLRVCLKL